MNRGPCVFQRFEVRLPPTDLLSADGLNQVNIKRQLELTMSISCQREACCAEHYPAQGYPTGWPFPVQF